LFGVTVRCKRVTDPQPKGHAVDRTDSYYYQDIRRKALREAYKLVEQFMVLQDDGKQAWTGRPSQCLARLRVLADRPAELVPVGRDEVL